MNNNLNEVRKPNKGIGERAVILILTALAAICTAISSSSEMLSAIPSASVGSFLLTAISVGAVAYLLTAAGKPAAALPAVALSAVAAYLVSKNIISSIVAVAFILVIAITVSVCIRKKLNFTSSSLAAAAVTAAVAAAALAYALYSAYGSITVGAGELLEGYKTSAYTALKSALSAYGEAPVIPDNELKELVSSSISIAPGIAAAAVEILGAAVCYLTYFIFRIFGKKEKYFPNGINLSANPTLVIFFAVSFIISVISSTFGGGIVFLAAVNMCLILAVPPILDGIERLVYRIRHPKTVLVTPDGRVLKKGAGPIIVLLITAAFIQLIFPFIILAFYSVAGTIKDLVVNAKNEKNENNR